MTNAEPCVALVSDANRGIGLEVCRQLAAHGMVVLLGAHDEAKERAAADRLMVGLAAGARRSGSAVGQLRAVALDVADAGSVRACVEGVLARHGRVDVLVANAGVHHATWQDAQGADLDGVVAEALATNLLGPWRLAQAVVPGMRERGWMHIVHVSSEAGSLASMAAGPPACQVSKAALNALARTLAGELRGTGILVKATCPGWVATDMGGTGGRPLTDGAASVV